MADTIIRRGYCVNDTIIQRSTDTVIINSITYVTDTFDLTDSCIIDTVLPSGTRITIIDNQLIVKEKQKVVVKTVTNTVSNYIRDKALENLLNKDVQATRDSLGQSRANVLMLKDMNKDLHNKLTKFRIIYWVLIIITLAYFIVKIYLRTNKFMS